MVLYSQGLPEHKQTQLWYSLGTCNGKNTNELLLLLWDTSTNNTGQWQAEALTNLIVAPYEM